MRSARILSCLPIGYNLPSPLVCPLSEPIPNLNRAASACPRFLRAQSLWKTRRKRKWVWWSRRRSSSSVCSSNLTYVLVRTFPCLLHVLRKTKRTTRGCYWNRKLQKQCRFERHRRRRRRRRKGFVCFLRMLSLLFLSCFSFVAVGRVFFVSFFFSWAFWGRGVVVVVVESVERCWAYGLFFLWKSKGVVCVLFLLFVLLWLRLSCGFLSRYPEVVVGCCSWQPFEE